MPTVNQDILRWARETAGLGLEEAVKKLSLNDARGVAAVDRLVALESGDIAPTRPMLVKMAKAYRRPLLTFYLSTRPRIGERGEDFRTLPDTFDTSETALVDVVVRDIRARQSLVKNALLDEEEDERLSFIGAATMDDGIAAVVRSLSEVLGFELEAYRSVAKIDDAFGYLRGLAEGAGVFVLLVDNLGSHHTTIPVEVFRGFALADDIAPFVAINANDSRGAWCFTLVHELAHLWLGQTGISGGGSDRKIEKFCNDVASEFLLPISELAEIHIPDGAAFDEVKGLISAFAIRRNVSSTMVAYKLHLAGVFSFEVFDQFRVSYRSDDRDNRARERDKNRASKSPGPSYYVIRKHRLGTALVKLVDRMMYGGVLTTTKAGKVLGVKAKSVQGVLDAARPNGIA